MNDMQLRSEQVVLYSMLMNQVVRLPRWETFRVVLMQERFGFAMR